MERERDELMKNVGRNIMYFAILLSVATFLSGCQGQVVCQRGKRTTINGVVSRLPSFFDEPFGTVCSVGSKCVKFTFHSQQQGFPVKSEYGSCSHPNLTASACASVAAKFEPSASPKNCNFETCSTFACNSFDLPSGCSNTPLPTDIRVLPNCTLRTSLRKVLQCLEPLVAGYPYNDQATCRSVIDSVLACGIKLMTICLSGPCPTVIDTMPAPIRGVYPQIVSIARNFTSLASLFSTLRVDSSVVDQIFNQVCPPLGVHQGMPLQLHNITFDQFLTIFRTTKQQLETTMINPICNSTALMVLMEKSFADAQRSYLAKDHESFCRSFNNLWSNIADTWKNHCSKTVALALITKIIPSAYSPLYPQVKKAMDIVEEEVFDPAVFPGCEGTSGVRRSSFWSVLSLLCMSVFVMIWF